MIEININISGDLEGLTCSTRDIYELINLLIEVEPKLEKKILNRDVNVKFISKSDIAELNSRFLNKNKPTNVLSFPSEGTERDNKLLGDIAICPEIIKTEAFDQNKDIKSHLSHIILHSLLHLTGFDHQDACEAEIMESLETMALKKIGIANPY